ncbi:antibiotic biosynthesis monooxygenase [Natronosporangium hydrolyticum]|uniref:Antibiotic biosynthesis monooxygenase n=1 Tax=Natronosporangium hydrolyticum TaxID=2811111 RepID=A0A895YGC6_9ACTN|nr:antibiotic biosynthesis monooxygenase [Natronosporangium hydrolyticum]QSB13240.1 antibiotic biosynthesis monooxygenase [Natronosporangium hydrolyticum]
MPDEPGFYSIIDYTVDGARTQQELVAAFAEIQEQWVRFYPGYRSARFFASVDGARVYNLIHWASEADYRHFEEVSDTEGRMAAIQQALAGLSGTAEPRMTNEPRYVMVRQVEPGPQRTGETAG